MSILRRMSERRVDQLETTIEVPAQAPAHQSTPIREEIEITESLPLPMTRNDAPSSDPSDGRLAPERERDRCPSVSLRGARCRGRRGHRALHDAEIDGALSVWSDEASPALAIDLLRSDD